MSRNFDENYEEYYLIKNGTEISSRLMKEHDKGHRPINYIEKAYFKELQLKNVSMRFFKWYLKKHCTFCDCELCGCDKGHCTCTNDDVFYDEKVMSFQFYDIIACSEKLKKEDLNALKVEYKNDNAEKKSQKNMSNEYFYAKIEYFISPTRYEKERHESYAIVYRDWAHIKPSGTNSKTKLKTNPKEYDTKILEKYFRRPDKMSKATVENIINKLSKSNPNLKLAKPPENEKANTNFLIKS